MKSQPRKPFTGRTIKTQDEGGAVLPGRGPGTMKVPCSIAWVDSLTESVSIFAKEPPSSFCQLAPACWQDSKRQCHNKELPLFDRQNGGTRCVYVGFAFSPSVSSATSAPSQRQLCRGWTTSECKPHKIGGLHKYGALSEDFKRKNIYTKCRDNRRHRHCRLSSSNRCSEG